MRQVWLSEDHEEYSFWQIKEDTSYNIVIIKTLPPFFNKTNYDILCYSSACKREKRENNLFISASRNFFATFSYISEKVDKILAGLKLEVLFFLEVPLSSEKTKAISVSSGKRPSNLLL